MPLCANLPVAFLLAIYIAIAQANYCGPHAIPFGASVSNDSSFILDCTPLPKCFSSRIAVHHHRNAQRLIGESRLSEYSPARRKKVVCQWTLWSTPCFKNGGWFAGGAPYSYTKRCCSSHKLKGSNIGQKLLRPGEKFIGGQHKQTDSQLAFDFISDVRKLRTSKGFKYLIVMARAVCISEPTKISTEDNPLFRHEGPHAVNLQRIKSTGKHGDNHTFQFGESETGIAPEVVKQKSQNQPDAEETTSSSSTMVGDSSVELTSANPEMSTTTMPELKKEHNTGDTESDDSTKCFTSPSGHRCCSRDVLKILTEMEAAISKEMEETDCEHNNTSIMKAMIRYIDKETRKKFCTPFEMIISRGQFASKSHTNSTTQDDGVALGCKTTVRIGGKSRFRRENSDFQQHSVQASNGLEDDGIEFHVLTYSTVVSATDTNSKKITFPHNKIPPPPATAVSASAQSSANAQSSSYAQSSSNAQSSANSAVNNAVAPAINPALSNPLAAAGAGAGACFSEDGTVETENGVKMMRDLVIGDKILSSTDRKMLTFSPVVSFLHRKPHERALFYQIEAENGAIIKLTSKHFLFVTDCVSGKYRRIYAAQAEVGQCLSWVDNEENRLKPTPIVNITHAWQTGIYAPLTNTATIVVNRILASCHSSVFAQQRLQQSYFNALLMVKSLFDWAFNFIHWQTSELKEAEESEAVFGAYFFSNVLDLIVPQLSTVS